VPDSKRVAGMIWKIAALLFTLWMAYYGFRLFAFKKNDVRDRRRNTRVRPVNANRYRHLWVIDREEEDERPTGT
jgi:hypothetical protein